MSANVHSLEAIDTVRVALVKFDDQVRDALTGLEVEMRRMLEWLEHDRPKYWKMQLRRAIDQTHEAQQALHRCLMFPIADERPSCYEERAALKAAQARGVYCQEKVERVRHWQQTVQHELFEYQGRISRLVRLVEVDTPQAIGVLQKILIRLEDYQAVRATDPRSAYNDLALAGELWPEKEVMPTPDAIDGEAASAAGTIAAIESTVTDVVEDEAMRQFDLATGAGRIRNALEKLEIAWNDASDQWNDAVSQRFREQHLDPMIPDVKLALDAISRVSLLMDEVERDCES